jgi:phospholipase D1/2
MKKQEEQSGVDYQKVQRAHAEEIMGSGIHGSKDAEGGVDTHMGMTKNDGVNGEQNADKKRRFEAVRDGELEDGTSFSVAHYAMADTGKLSEETWPGEPQDEVENWIQEELYVHAKLLIVDDRIVICGSSNLNDRSQIGHHDSELSIVMEDTDKIQSVMDGQPFEAGRHAATLRRYLWREHMGLLPPQSLDGSNDINAQPPGDDSPNDPWDRDESYKFVEDPMSEDLWKMWTESATTNTEIFRHLFHADPDDNGKRDPLRPTAIFPCLTSAPVKTFDDYYRFLPPKGVKAGHIFDRFLPPEDVRSKLDKVQGHLVWMPLDFLQDANMAEVGLQVNQFTESVYT